MGLISEENQKLLEIINSIPDVNTFNHNRFWCGVQADDGEYICNLDFKENTFDLYHAFEIKELSYNLLKTKLGLQIVESAFERMKATF